MKAEIKQQWLAKLRSGEIKQAKRVLCDDGGAMCCLGVLLDIYAPAGWGAASPNTFTDSVCRPHTMATEDRDFLPVDACELFGLNFLIERDDGSGYRKVAHHLARMNDQGKSFAEIADWIEQNIPAESNS